MGPLQVPCACGDGSRKVLVSWPKGLQKPNSIVGTFGDQEQESFCPFTEKQRKPSPGSASLSRFPMNFAMPMQPKQHHSNIWSLLHCKASLCIPGWWSFLFSHPVPAHQLSWSPQFCVLWPFVSVKVVLEVVFEISSWVLWHELNPGIGAGEMHSTQLLSHIHTDQSSWGPFIGFSWTGGFHTSIIPSQRADFHFKDLAVLKRGFSTYTESI